jgi:hypothetical protein
MLWMVAWEQTPCGSLPEDDTLIAARIGMSPKTFQRHRALLMRGWWLADDGRLYHDVLVQRVREMLAKRVKDAVRAANKRGRDADNAAVTHESRVTRGGVRGESDTKHQAPEPVSLPSVEIAGPPLRVARPSSPPDFDGKNGETLNGKSVVPIAAAWELPEAWGVDAEALGFKPGEVLREAERFRQYWVAGKGQGTRRSVKGWRQTWSNWLAKAAEKQR